MLFTVPIQAQQLLQELHGHVRPAVSRRQATLVGPLPGTQKMQLSIVLPLRNQAGLTALLDQLYDPSSTNYRHFLSVDQFTERFSPTVEDYQSVVNFAQANGFSVTATPANRLVVPVSGTVAQVEAAFNVRMNDYQHPTEKRTFFSPDREPSLALNVPVAHIAGLNNFSIPRPAVTKASAAQSAASAAAEGSGPGGAYLSSDMRAAYYGGGSLTGSGQTVGLAQFDGFDIADLVSDLDGTASWSAIGSDSILLTYTPTAGGTSYSIPVNIVLLDGATGAACQNSKVTCGDVEEALDIAQAVGMAPGLSQVRVYIGSSDADIFNSMAAENIAKQISVSWTWSPDDPATDDPIFEELAAQGQSIFVASGDNGAYAPGDSSYPAEDAWVTAAGGTDLTTTGAGGTWSSETAWIDSGGGISPDRIPIPSWQAAVAGVAGGSTALRNVPDVAAEGNFDNYACNLNACDGTWGGTSFAAPRWAGFMALVNQQAIAAGDQAVGFVNPALYSIGDSTSYGTDFNDMLSGNNDCCSQQVWYGAAPGYDLVTGWGSPAGQSLINDLTGPPSAGFQLTASPSSLTISPSASATTTIAVQNLGGFTGNVSLSVSGLPSSVTATWNTNPATGSDVLTLTAGSSANHGSYAVTITGVSGSLTARATLAVLVNAPGFSIAPASGTIGMPQGSSQTTTITVTDYAGFAGEVNLSVSGLPTGVTAFWTANPTTGSSLLTLTASNTASVNNTTGAVPVTITGVSGTQSATTIIQLTVFPPGFDLAISPEYWSIPRGGSVISTVTLTPYGDYSGSVTLTAPTLPSGMTAAFNPNPTTNGNSVLTLTASSSTPLGPSWVEILGTDANNHSSYFEYEPAITAAPSPTFTVGVSPGYQTVTPGSSATATVTVSELNGFTGGINLSASNLPSGVTASFSPNSTTGGTSVFTLSVSSSTAPGFYPLYVVGQNGGQYANSTFFLIVNPAPIFSLPSGTFGDVNIGVTSSPSSVAFTFANAETLEGIAVLTQGAAGLDFADAGSDTCTPNTAYTPGESCTVNVSFTPRFAGTRYGAVVLEDNNGNPIATSYLQGTGIGPQVNFLPGAQSTLGNGFTGTAGVATDGSGNVYVADSSNNAVKQIVAVNGSIPASPTINTLGSGFSNPIGVAVDGGGNVYVADFGNNAVKQIVAVNGSIPASPIINTLGSGFNSPAGVAVDGSGDVYVADFGNNAVKEILAINGTIPASPTINTLGSGFSNPSGVAVDLGGNVYVGDSGHNEVKEMLAVNGSIPTSPPIEILGSGFSSPHGVAVDGNDNVYVADFGNNAVKEIQAVNGSIPTSPVINTLGSGYSSPYGVAVNGAGNVFVADFTNNRIEQLDFADPPSLNFPSVGVGSTGTAQTVTVENVGNVPLSFPIPSAGNNPSIAANFTLTSGGTTDCSLVSASSSTAGTLAAGASCQLPISFTPTAGGALTGWLMLTDNSLNATAPGYTSQSIALSGTGLAGFTLQASPASLSIPETYSGSSTITVNPFGGFAGNVTLAASGLPSGVTASFSPNPATGASALTLTTSGATALGTYNLIITGTSGTLSSTITLSLTVTIQPSFTLSASPATITLFPGTSSTTVITVTGKNGFTGGVSLTAPLPSGITASFTPNPATGTSVLTLTASSSMTPTSTSFPVTGTSGSLTGTANVNIQMPSFSLAASPNSVTMGQGASATTTVTVHDINNFAGNVNLSVSGLPSGVTASFTPNPATGTSLLTLTSSSSASGFAQGTIQGICANPATCGTLTATTPFYLTVSPPSFSLVSPAPAISIAQGGSGTSTITVRPLYGFTGDVSLAATQLPKGVTASFTPNPTTGTSVLTLTASSTSENGSFSVLITGTSGNVTATTYVPLSISLNPAATFTLSATPVTITGVSGASSQSTVAVTFPSGYAGDVTLTASGAPVDFGWQFSPIVVYGSGTSALTLSIQGPVTTGTYNITVTGTSGTLTVNTSFVLTILAPTYTLSSSVSYGTIIQGASLQSTITVTPSAGYSGSVNLTASGLSSGLTASFAPNPATTTSILTLTASNSASIANPTVLITASDGTHSVSTPIYISTIAAPQSFSLGAAPSSLMIAQGNPGTSTISVTDQGGFTGNVTFAASSLPAGVTAIFTPNPTTGTSALTFSASSSVAVGTYNVTITGTSGSLTATTNVALTINTSGFAPPSANYGLVNIGAASPMQTLTYSFDSAVTLGSTAVLTQGAAGLDFADAGSDTCALNTAYTAGQSCTVNVIFTPEFAGTRYGAVVLNDNNGNVIATAYLQGTGVGPQLSFLPSVQSALGSGYNIPNDVAVDSSGDVFVADFYNFEVKEILAVNGRIPSSPTINTIGSGFDTPSSVAIDGSGNVFVADQGYSAVYEVLKAGGYTTVRTLGGGFLNPTGVAVDGVGNVYVADFNNNAVKEIPLGCVGSTCVTTLGSGFTNPYGVTVDSNANVFVSDSGNSSVKEILAVGGYTTINTLVSGLSFPAGLAVDGNSNLYVADAGDSTVLEIMAASGYSKVNTLTGSFDQPYGVAVDQADNVYVADSQNNRVEKLDFADAPSLTFASTAIGATSTDSPQTVTVENVGNAALSFPIPASGNNPSIGANFILNSGGASACPLVNGGSSAAGTLAAGASCQLPISFTPTAAGTLGGFLVLTDNNLNAAAPGYTSQGIALSGTASQATPTITWAVPAAIIYGTALSSTQLNASSTIAGTFTYSPGAGTVLTAGAQTLSVTFTPTDTADYTTATATVTITVNQATPAVTWAAPAAITYGTALSGTQLNATSTIPGTFTYSPAAGTVLTAGSQPLTATFIPTDTVDYTSATATTLLTVNKAAPAVTWPNPAAITYGTALSNTQLNATSTIPGTFTYSPAAGTVLGPGQQTLMATLTPTNTTDYTTATASVTLTVNKGVPSISWATPAAITYGTALSATQLNATSTVAGTFNYSPAAGSVLNAGTQTLTVNFTPTNPTDYSVATATVGLIVNKAALTINWPAPAAISYGTVLSGTQLDATSTAVGAFAYSPAAGTVPTVGKQTLTVVFTPTNLANYTPSTATASVTLTVNKATPTITWATPTAISYGTALSATQLDATSTVAGTFAYSPTAGTVLSAGQQTLNVTFAPTNTTDYATATASVTLTVNKVTPAITWATPKAITYGTALSATQLNATSTVAGTFAYSPTTGTVLSAGQQTLTVTFTPTNTTDYATTTAGVTLTVNKVTPAITWATPKAITYGTALSATQLNATSTVAGTFAYSPTTGTVLSAGQQTLTVTFTPTNTTDYLTTTASVILTVNPAPSFTLGDAPASLAVAQGASGKTTITVSGKNGFTSSVTLAVSGLPSGVTAALGTNPTTGTSILTLTASSTAVTGTSTVAINGTSGSLTASTTIALAISCTPTAIVPYIYVNGAWTEESSVTVTSPSTVVDLGPQPSSGGSWSWTGPSGYTSASREINSIPLTKGTDSYLATYTNASGCKSTETFTITVK
jgi:uncharacterized membrane protein